MFGGIHEGDLDEVGQVIGHGFGVSRDSVRDWLTPYIDQVRVRRGSKRKIEGTVLRIPMAQFFGGRSVSMCGIAGVTMAGSARGRGAGTDMMKSCVQEMKRDGFALSVLYASTAKLYRRVGWENAGTNYMATLQIRELPRDRSVEAYEYLPSDEPAVRKCYRKFAQMHAGWLDRSEYIWPRTRREMDGRCVHGFVIGPDRSRPEGYLFYRLKPGDDIYYQVQVTDYAFTTGRAASRILGLLAEHRALSDEARIAVRPQSPLLLGIPDHRYAISVRETWMLRVVDVAKAIEERGYPKSLELRFSLSLKDEIIRANRRTISVTVKNGRATVKPSKAVGAKMHIRTFASIYSGFASPEQLAAAGRIEAKPATLEKLALAFSGAPTLVDFF